MRTQIRVLLLIGIAVPRLAQAVDNSWTNVNAGKWETNSNWSLGVAPASAQSVFVTNAFSKTVTIDSITSGSFPGTMTVSNLTVSAPTVPLSANRLSLDNSGLATPLRVPKILTVTTNGTLLVLDNAAVEVGSAAATGFLLVVGGGLAQCSGGSLIASNAIISLGSAGSGALTVSDGTRICSEVRVGAGTGSQGTFTINGGTNLFTSSINVGFGSGSTGAVWMTGGLLVTTNNTFNVGDFSIGQMAVSNGTWLARFVFAGRFTGSRGTLTYAGGTNFVSDVLQLGEFNASTGTVVVSGGQLFVTNASNTASIDIRTGTLIVTGATVVADRLIATNSRAAIQFPAGTLTLRGAAVNTANTFGMGGAGRTAVLNLVGGTNDFSGDVDVARVVGGQLVATNNFALMLLGLNGVGQMTVSNGNNWIGDMVIGQNGGSRGTLTIAGGTNQFTTEFLVGAGLTSTGVVSLTGGQLVVTNNNILTAVGYSANGEMMVFPSGKLLSSRLSVGFGSGARGTFTLAGATLDLPTDFNGLAVGENPGATGAVWLITGSLIVTNPAVFPSAVGLAGNGQMTVSNAFFRSSDLFVGQNAGSRGTLTMAGGTNLFDSFLSIGASANATGTVWVTGGRVVVTNNIISVAGAGVGRMTISNGVVQTQGVTIGAKGTFTMAGGSLVADQLTAITTGGRIEFPGGTMTLRGALVTNDQDFLFGGAGQTAVLNLVAGTNHIGGDLVIAIEVGSTGTLWFTAGQMIVTNGGIFVGERGLGQMTISNGTCRALEGFVGDNAGSRGTLTTAGGTNSVYSRLIVGNSACTATGLVNVTAGSLFVTNAAGNATLEVRSGTFTMSGGAVKIDRLVVTNACGRFIHTGGTLSIASTNLLPNLAVAGDGLPWSWKQQFGFDVFDPAVAGADSDGDGLTNLQEFQAGTNPTNSNSFLGITSITRVSTNILITWMTGPGKTNALQRTAGDPGGSYTTNNFATIFTVTNTVGTTTNCLDVGGATNTPARYYRVRLVP
jgi:hypothetical protein